MEHLLPTLLDLGTSLGVDPDLFRQGETAKRVYLEVETPCAAAQSLTLVQLRSAVNNWGSALSLHITSEYGVREFHVQSSVVGESAFPDFMDDLRTATAGETIKVKLSIDKTAFVKGLNAQRDDVPIALYLFSSSVIRALAGDFPDVERIFFSEASHCCCLLLDSPSFALSGPYFSVWGSDLFAANYRTFRPSRAKRLAEANDTRREQVSWLDFQTVLTPYHFSAAYCSDHESLIFAKALELHYLLAVLYLADSVRRDSDSYVATFAGHERVEVAVSRPTTAVLKEHSGLYKLFIWTYSGNTVDKLPILRSVIASELGSDRNNNYQSLIANAQGIFNSSRHNYAAFVGGFVTKYFDKLREVDEYVRNTGVEIANRVSDLVKSLTANLLATVGVVVGGFVAYALDKKSSPELLAVGLRLYGVYILGFPLLYSLILHGLVDYWITMNEFRRHMAELQTKLHAAGLTYRTDREIRGRSRHFWFVILSSAFVYLAIGVSCFILAGTLKTLLPATP